MKNTLAPAVCSALALAALCAPSATAQKASQASVQVQANMAYGLNQSSIQSLSIQGNLGGAVRTTLNLDGQLVSLRLFPHSVRADDFRLLTQVEDGSIIEIDAPEVRSMRGTVAGVEGSIVAASWLDDGLYARVRLAEGVEYWVQPIVEHVPTADPAQHLVYQSSDVAPVAGMCGNDLISNAYLRVPSSAVGGPTTQLGSTISICELGVDADFEYYQEEGSSTTNTQNQINAVINSMNLQYESEVEIRHLITTTIIRTTSNDPYSSTNSSTLLNQFVNEWNSNQGGIQRDVAHLFTGKNIQGGVIGIAYLGVICHGSLGYGLVESNFNNNFSCATDLSAHELGHNWDADHCSCPSNTMNPSITCANTFHASFTRPDIISHRNSRNCLDSGTGNGPPAQVANPVPGNGATNVVVNVDLAWGSATDATSYDVYFGTDSTPDAGEFQINHSSTSYNVGTLSTNTTYYWRIDSVNVFGTTTGLVWSFTTEPPGGGNVNITSVVPSTIDALIPGTDQSITINGSGFTPTSVVQVDGVNQTGFPSPTTYVNSTQMTLDMPQLATLGSHTITVVDGASTDTANVSVVAPAPPKLQVGNGDIGNSIFSASGIPVTVSGVPGNIHLVVYSKSNVPSLSTFVNLDLGNNFAQVPYLNPFVVNPVSGWDTRTLTPASVPAFTTFYFQSIDVTTGSFPLDVSNLQEILIIF